MISRLHRKLRDRRREQQAALLAAAATDDREIEAMEDLASALRVGTAHAELPIGSTVWCATCGHLDIGEDCDLFWHPWTAPL